MAKAPRVTPGELADIRRRVLEQGGLPPDFPTIPQWPEGRYLEVYQVAVA